MECDEAGVTSVGSFACCFVPSFATDPLDVPLGAFPDSLREVLQMFVKRTLGGSRQGLPIDWLTRTDWDPRLPRVKELHQQPVSEV